MDHVISPDRRHRETSVMRTQDTTVTLIEPVIDQSLALLRGRATTGDMTQGMVAGLRRVRVTLEELGGYSLVSLVDAAIRDRLIIRNLRRNRIGVGTRVDTLPPGGASTALAATVIVAAVESCLAYALQESDLSSVMVLVFLLVDRLIEILGELPSYNELVAALRLGEDDISLPHMGIDIELVESVH